MTDEREEFEAWFKAVEEGDGEIPLPTPADGKRWDEYVLRHALAWGAWQARASLGASEAAPKDWRNPMNRSAWTDAVAVASFAPMTGKVTLDARVVLEANSLLAVAPPAAERMQTKLERAERSAQVFAAERDHARACYERSIKILVGIHSLMYPAPLKLPDGRTMVFRPSSPDPHEMLQWLSDRIRAIPDEVAAIEQYAAPAPQPHGAAQP